MRRISPPSFSKLAALAAVSIIPLILGQAQCNEPEECIDLDLDGYGEGGCPAPDCDDANPMVHPFVAEDCSDGADNDCDHLIDADDLECHDDGMVAVEAGPFLRGLCNGGSVPPCEPGDPGFQSSYSEPERPLRTITLDGYLIDAMEVSVEAFAVCVDAGACNPLNFATYNRNVICHFGKPGYEDHPMNCVGWFGATEYCAFAGKRLPTEAEWEKAARGTEGEVFPWGNDSPNCTLANYSNATNQWCVEETAPINSFPAGVSPYGALNMAGNVWEWVNDWYHPDYYDTDFPLPDFSPDVNPMGPDDGEYRLIRGGSWVSSESFIRTTFKHYYPPTTATEDLGFRCVRDL